MVRLGINQLRMLTLLGSPATLLLVGDAVSDSLVKRGLARQDKVRRGVVVTPDGLRRLADEMEAGRVKDALRRMRADVAKMNRRIAARERRRS